MKLFGTLIRLLTFRTTQEELRSFEPAHLVIALIGTWLVGMGRWWDDPTAVLLQKSGAGSLAYILFLSVLLFAVGYPLRRDVWRYRDVLTFVGLTALPAALYAIPIERFMPLSAAAYVNLAFLLIVAAWRVGLLGFFLKRYGGFSVLEVFVAMLLPLACIVALASFLDLSRGLIQIMGGVRDDSADTLAASVTFILGMFAYVSAIPLVVGYAILVVVARRLRRQDVAVAPELQKVPPKSVA